MPKFIAAFIAFFTLTCSAYAAPPPVSAYAQLPAVFDAALSPDGQYMAAIMENDGAYIVRVFNIVDGSDKTVRATALPTGAYVKNITWANNDRILVRVGTTQFLDTGTSSAFVKTGFILTMPKSLKKADILIKPKKARQGNSRIGGDQFGFRQFNDHVIDYLPSDPKNILMVFSDEDANAPNVNRVDVKTGRYKKVRRGSESFQQWFTDRRGQVRVGQGRASTGDTYVMTIRDADGDNWQSSNDYPDLDADDLIHGFMENPNELIVGRYNGKKTLGLFIYDLAAKSFTRKLFQHDTYDVSGIVLSADGKRVIGAEYIADSVETVFFDAKAKARMETIQSKLAGYTLRFMDETPDGNKVLLKAHAPDVPASLILFNVSTGKWMNMGNDYPALSGFTHAHVQPVKYTVQDGESIPGYVTLPQKVLASGKIENVPFIVLPHGGPFSRDTASFDYIAQYLASRGYGVLQMNFRGSIGYGFEFQQAGRSDWRVMQSDVTDGAKWLLEKGYADKDRLCIMGWSYGGYAALMGAVEHSDMYKCAISIAGVTDLPALADDLMKFRFGRRMVDELFSEGFESQSQMRKHSPARRADSIRIPIFLAHGTKDANVDFSQFKAMESALKGKANITSVRLEGSDHSVTDGPNRVKLFEALDAFLAQHLGSSEYAPE